VPSVEDVDLARSFAAQTDDGLDIPRPFHSGLTLMAIGLLPLAAGAAGLIRPLTGLVFAAIFVAAGALQALLAYLELARLRRRADGELRNGRRPYFSPALVSWRSSELVSARHRQAVARAVTRTERALSPSTLPNASPLNRVAARPHVDLIHTLAERLAALDHPIEPRGVLLVEELLTSPGSPLYERERAGELRASLLECIEALDAPPEPVPAAVQRRIPAGVKSEVALPASTNHAATSRLRDMAHSHRRKGKH
jgi:hypothetical protein